MAGECGLRLKVTDCMRDTIQDDCPLFHIFRYFLFEIKGKYFMANGRMFMFASKYMGKGKQNAKRQKAVSSKSELA